jgi:hypothetical protein
MASVPGAAGSSIEDELLSKEYARYGDSIKLFTTSQYVKELAKEKGKLPVGVQLGGYLGVYEKKGEAGTPGTARLAVPPVGDSADGVFKEQVFMIQDPTGLKKEGDVVLYSDMLILVDENGMVWNNKCSTTFSGFFEAYLGPRPRGTSGELYISFMKNGHDGRPVVYGDIAVYVDVESSHRNRSTYNQRLTNYKSSSSRVLGGYVCSDGTGYDLAITVHRHTGPPLRAYQSPVADRRALGIAKRRSFRKEQQAGTGDLGTVFVPPEIKYVAVQRKHVRDDSGAPVLDVMIRGPIFGKPIKLFDVCVEDSIVLELDQACTPAVLQAVHLFNAAESAAQSGSTEPIQLDVVCGAERRGAGAGAARTGAAGAAGGIKKQLTPKFSASGSRVVELTSVELLIEQDLPVLQRAFEDEVVRLAEDDSDAPAPPAASKIEVLIAMHKLVIVFFLFCSVLPYFVWQAIVAAADLIEPLHQAGRGNGSLALAERLASTLVRDFGIAVENGRALVTAAHREAETTTPTTALLSMLLCVATGLCTPPFARRGPGMEGRRRAASAMAVSEGRANWLISIQVPENAWDTDRMFESATSAATIASTRTIGAAVEDELEEEEEEEPEVPAGEGSVVLNERLGGLWGKAGVGANGVPLHPAFQRFLNGEKGNMDKALQRWVDTCKWREEGKVDKYLDEPHPWFDVIKKYVPNYYYGVSKLGHPVYIDCPGGVRLKALKKAGVELVDLLFHFVFMTEFSWTILEPSELGRTVTILDLEGIGMFDFAGDVVNFVRKSIAISGAHYPERAHKIFIINSPSYFTGIWAVIKGWLDENTRQKIFILGTLPKFKDKLLEVVDADQLPEKYGGTNKAPLGGSYEERLLESHVCRVLLEKGVPMRGEDGQPMPGSPENLRSRINDKLTGYVSRLKLDLINSSTAVKVPVNSPAPAES